MENGQYTDSQSDIKDQSDLSISEDNKSAKFQSQSWISRIIDHMVDDTMPIMFKTQLDLASKNMKKVVDYIMRHL